MTRSSGTLGWRDPGHSKRVGSVPLTFDFCHSVPWLSSISSFKKKDAIQNNSNKHFSTCGMCMSSTLEAFLFLGIENYLDNLLPSKIQEKISHLNKCSTYLKSRTIRWDLRTACELLGWFFHGKIYPWLTMKKSSVPRTRRLTYFQILCCVLKDERDSTIKYCLGRQVNVIQNSSQ